MDYLQNHCFSNNSNWGTDYLCRHIVSFNAYEEHNKNDWNNLINPTADVYVDPTLLELSKTYHPDISNELRMKHSTKSVPNLYPHVLQWLDDNVADRKDSTCSKGWATHDDEGRYLDKLSFVVFFHRKRDAMNFIKEFSEHKKPVHYCHYFDNVRKELNFETNKLEPIK